MIITEKQLRDNCTIVERLNNERFFAKKDGDYFTIYENKGELEDIVVEVSTKDIWMTPDELWGIIRKRTKGSKIFIEKKEFKKFVEIERDYKQKFIDTISGGNIINLKNRISAKNRVKLLL